MLAAQTSRIDILVDWFGVIADLNRAGLPTNAIGPKIGVAEATLHGWKSLGARPRYEDGERLLDLWQRTTGKTRESVPRVNRYSPKR